MKNQKGFTLIELVMVIVLLGILAAVAIPRFWDLGEKADKAAADGGIGGIQSGLTTLMASQAVAGTYNSTNPYPLNPLGSASVTGLYSLTTYAGANCTGVTTLAQGQWGVDTITGGGATCIAYRWKSSSTKYSSWGYSSASGVTTPRQDS